MKVTSHLIENQILDKTLGLLKAGIEVVESKPFRVLGEHEDFSATNGTIDGIEHLARHTLPRENGRRDHLWLQQILLV